MSGRPLLVVSADDFGLTDGVCRGILDAHRDGIVTSTAVLATSEALDRWVGPLLDSGLDAGVHLAVVGEEPPLLTAAEIPTLVDERGAFRASWRQFVRRAALGRVDPDDLRREFSAQLESVSQRGVRVSHLDTHQHVHLWPSVAVVVADLAAEHHLAVRLPDARRRSPVGIVVGALRSRLAAALSDRCVAAPAGFAGIEEAGHLDAAALWATLTRLIAGGGPTMELATHPGTADDPARSRYEWGYRWDEELAALCDPTLAGRLDRAGVTLGSFADLARPVEP